MKEMRRAAVLVFAASLPFALLACGPAGASIGDACPDQPLYTWEYDASTEAWTRVHVGDGGQPLSADELAAVAAADKHCLTPAGSAATLSPNDAGTTTPLDASKD